MAKTALDRAERLFSAGRHAEVISLLEPQVPIYRESHRFYYLLGVSCLVTGDAGGAFTYLKRSEQLNPGSPDAALALAALSVRRGETDKAVEAYLRVLEERPGDRLAKRALALLRSDGSPERLAALVQSGGIARIYPGRRPLARMARPIAAAAAIVLALAAALIAGPALAAALRSALSGGGPRPEVAAVSLSPSERASPVTSGGSFRYVLTEPAALAAFERAKAAFQAYRDNAALVEINRLLDSNASPALKEKAKILRGFVGKPDFRTVKDAPDYQAFAKDPVLYDGCAVAWKGMAANVRPDGGGLSFSFLVGYHEMKRLEGVLPARIVGAEVPVDRPLEILAVIRSRAAAPSLEGVAIHELSATR